MKHERRNPYLILGVDPSATADVARAAHARKRMAAGDNPDPAGGDIDWALDQLTKPNRSAWYLVPGDPSVYRLDPDVGLFAPPAEPLERGTRPPSAAEIDALTARALRQALDAVVGSLGTALFRGPYDDQPEQLPPGPA